MLRIDTRRVVQDQEALVVTVAGEIDLLTVDRLRAAVSDGFDQLPEGAILVIDLTDVTFQARRVCRPWSTLPGRPGGGTNHCALWSTHSSGGPTDRGDRA
jgi:hypothetical protein